MTNDKQNEKSMMSPRCPVSGSFDVRLLCKVDDFQVWRCPESATDFVWPMPNDAELNKIYERAEWFNGGERGGYLDYDTQTEPSLKQIVALLDRFPNAGQGLAVLDVGCGYGSHLKLAADRGWRCFGVETSAHARSVAAERYGKKIKIVERAEELLPQHFDLVLMLDVIEHLRDPYKLFFTLFGKGAIDPDTLVVISTPNARSFDAMLAPADWVYRHPPSHLIFYSAKSLELVLRRLMFTDIKSLGAVECKTQNAPLFDDESSSVNDALVCSQGLWVEATGSHFKEFMHERYVPGGFWKLTEYEHKPRYNFAALFAKGLNVLDFGCGTGYGSALLSEVANSVVGLDISTDAIKWAQVVHARAGLTFQQRADLGMGLPAASFDVVSCFEMIEHVNYETQTQAIASIARLLTPAGKLIISTPDPSYTAPYGDNPYHLREMTEAEFTALLEPHFKYVRMLKQWVRPSIAIAETSIPEDVSACLFGTLERSGGFDSLIGFVAICSNEPFELPPYFCQFDTTTDFNLATLATEHKLNELRLEVMGLATTKEHLESEIVKWVNTLSETRAWAEKLSQEKTQLESEIVNWVAILSETRAWAEKLNQEKIQLESKLSHKES